MLKILFNSNFDDYIIIASTIAAVGLAFSLYNSYTEHKIINRINQVEAAREQEGLPNNVTLTPEDFRQNPELAEIFNTDTDKNLNLNLETIEHIELIENQGAAIDIMDYIVEIEVFLFNCLFYTLKLFQYVFFLVF